MFGEFSSKDYDISVCFECLSLNFRRVIYISLKLEKNYGQPAFHTLTFSFQVNPAIQ